MKKPPKWAFQTKHAPVYYGTGDIPVMPKPKRSHRDITETEADEVAQLLFEGKLKSDAQITKLADKLNIEPWKVSLLGINPNVQKGLEERVRGLALAKMPAIVEAQAERAKEDVKSADFVGKAAGVIKSGGGAMVQVNTAVDTSRKGGNSEQVVAMIETFRQRQLGGLQRRLGNGNDPEPTE